MEMTDYNHELIEVKKLEKDFGAIFTDVGESGIDLFIDSELLKAVPVIKTAQALMTKYQESKLAQFIYTVNSGVATSGEINIHIENLRSNKKQLVQEVNYILGKITSLADMEKIIHFGNLYVAYLRKRICWDELRLYTDILEQIIVFDITVLKELYELYKYDEHSNPPFASMLRLQSLGLAVFHDGYVRQTSKNTISGQVKKERGHITDEGKAFYRLITESRII